MAENPRNQTNNPRLSSHGSPAADPTPQPEVSTAATPEPARSETATTPAARKSSHPTTRQTVTYRRANRNRPSARSRVSSEPAVVTPTPKTQSRVRSFSRYDVQNTTTPHKNPSPEDAEQAVKQPPRHGSHAVGGFVPANPTAKAEYETTTGSVASYKDVNSYKKKRKRNMGNKIAGIAALVAAAAIGIGAWVYTHPAVIDVTINGEEYSLNGGTTINDVIDQGIANPESGDLLAVDGSVLEAGAGDAFSGTINGRVIDSGSEPLTNNDEIFIDDGADIVESSTSVEEAIPYPAASDGIGAIHLYTEGTDGVKTTTTGDISGLTVEQVTKEPVPGGFYRFNVETDEKVVALTFDDGPWPSTTEAILDVLKENNAKATFFTIGNQISEQPSAVKRAYQEGHQISTHTWDHAAGSGQGVNLGFMSAQEQIDEVLKGYSAIESVTGVDASRVIRAPGGNYDDNVMKNLEPYVTAEIFWNIDTEDWRRPGSSAIYQSIISAQPGDVVLMHDGGGDRSQTVEALRQALPYLAQQGYSFVTIDELIALSDAADAATK